jgi:hypothetical protein
VLSDLGFAQPLANFAVPLRPFVGDAAAADIATRALDFYGERPFVIWSPWPVPDLAPHGLKLMGHPRFMVRPPGPPSLKPTDLVIEEVSDGPSIERWARAFVAGYPVDRMDGRPMVDGRVLDGATRYFTGTVDDEVVATASAHIADGVCQVEFVAVSGDHRGHGFGEAITWAATLAEPGLPAVLLASDDGQPVYERMGYRRVSRWTLWGNW